MKLLYFAWVRERIGLAEEDVEPPADIRTVAELMAWLGARGPGYEQAFANPRVIRAAVDHTHAPPEAPVANASVVAFFPPMTGG